MIKLCACGCGQPTKIANRTDRRHGAVLGRPNRYITGHNQTSGLSWVESLERYEPEPNSGCWLWTGPADLCGYGLVSLKGTTRGAHRAVYEALVGQVPPGLTIDHLCRVRSCVNPAHMEPVLHRVNVLRGSGPSARNARKTHCSSGHEYTGRDRSGRRFCPECRREYGRRYSRVADLKA